MVYAPYGRAGIYLMQEYCRLLDRFHLQGSERVGANTLKALPSSHPIANAMRAGLDFSHPDALADALLHPLDRGIYRSTVIRLARALRMSFGRWVEQAPIWPSAE